MKKNTMKRNNNIRLEYKLYSITTNKHYYL